MTDIRERFAASKHWQWMEGMNTGDALVVSVLDGNITEVVFDGELMQANAKDRGDDGDWYDTRGVVPYLTDATLGCIEHELLPKAWPGCAIRVMRWTTPEGEVLASVTVYERPCTRRFSIVDVPLAEALVAALEAAPGMKPAGPE